MDLTQRPPRSARARLGGFVILPRMLDKCRATLAGTNGEYHYDCPLDKRFLDFVGIDADALKQEVAKGLGDGEILAWIESNAKFPRADWERASWSQLREAAPPSDNGSRDFVNDLVTSCQATTRTDLGTWFEVLDLDDYVTYGGKA